MHKNDNIILEEWTIYLNQNSEFCFSKALYQKRIVYFYYSPTYLFLVGEGGKEENSFYLSPWSAFFCILFFSMLEI